MLFEVTVEPDNLYNGKQLYGIYIEGPLSSMMIYDKEVTENDIAEFLSMKVEDYRDHLIKFYNGIKHLITDEVFFLTKEDSERAVEWLNSLLVAINLLDNKPKPKTPDEIYKSYVWDDNAYETDFDELKKELRV